MQLVSTYVWALGPWWWFILAVLLFVLETVVPGVHFLWFGIAALLVGLLALMTGFAWQWQLIAFGLVAVATVFWVRRYVRPDNVASDEPDLNVRALQYVGRLVLVEEPICGGRGKVRVGDTVWAAEGPDLPRGAQARVKGANGPVLLIEPR